MTAGAWQPLAGRAAAKDRPKDSYYGGLPIGIQSYSLRKFGTDEALRHVHGLGLRYIEFYGAHFSPGSSKQQIEAMLKKLAELGITVNAHGVHGFTKDHEKNRKLFEFAKQAGIRNLTANPQPDSFDSLDKLVEEYDIRIAIHNHGPGALYDELPSVQKAVDSRHKNIGACIDTGHVLRSGEDQIHWAKELGPRVFALHIKDVAEMQKRTHDVVLGEGHLDMVELFSTLAAIDFPADGSLSLEYESNPANPIDDIRQCLAVVDKAIGKVQAKG